jgi:hypothetical protein
MHPLHKLYLRIRGRHVHYGVVVCGVMSTCLCAVNTPVHAHGTIFSPTPQRAGELQLAGAIEATRVW